MRCPNCNKDIEKEFVYCPYCGYNISKSLKDVNISFDIAKSYLGKSDYENAIFWLKISSKLGNDNAMYEYGMLFLDGKGVNKNQSNFEYCMSSASNLGNIKAKKVLLDFYINNKDVFDLSDGYDKAHKIYESLPEDISKEYKDFFITLDEIFDDEIFDDEEDDYDEEYYGEDDVEDTKSIGKIDNEIGILNNVKFNEINNSKNIFNEEQQNLTNFYLNIDNLLKYMETNKKDAKVDVSNYSDKDDWKYSMERKEYINNIQQKIDDIKYILPKPYIGRMIVEYDDGLFYDIYIGKESIQSNSGKMLVYSWYSPLGNKFYDDTKTQWIIKGYDVYLKQKRNIEINDTKLIDVYESFNILDNSSNNKLISDKYLVSVLQRRRQNSEIKNIISSIQQNQNQIITTKLDKNIIMQGCAGCGKTMVLFHRIKYIIGNNLKEQNSIVVITPNKNFNNFIKPLIVDLNLSNIETTSISDYYIKKLDSFQKKKKWINFINSNRPLLKILDDDDLPENIVKYYYSLEFFNKVNNLQKIKIKPLSDSNIKKAVAKNQFDIIDLVLGKKEKDLLPIYERKRFVIHKCELFALCLFYFKRCGKFKYQEKEYNFNNNKNEFVDYNFDVIMIDEAQNLSQSEIMLINSLNKKTSILNLFGDIEQRIYDYSIKSWTDVSDAIGNFEIYSLNKNYRNSSEIIRYVNKVCNKNMEDIGYNSYKVMEVPFNKLESNFKLENFKNKIIVSNNNGKEKLLSLFPHLNNYIYSVNEIKGMEFECVYVYENNMTQTEKYISMTRALDKLVVIKN